MRKQSTAVILAVVTTGLLWSSGKAQDQSEQLRAIEHERLRSLVNADIDTANRLHADDFELVNPAGATLTKEQYIGQIASGELDYLVWEPEVISVRLYGAAAVIRYRARAQAMVGGQTTPLRFFWHTDVYEKRNDRWQVVWSQATQIQ
jgi:hypothetical protein